MSRKKLVEAECDIPFGARILVRGTRAIVADASLANATAPTGSEASFYARHGFTGFCQGDWLFVQVEQGADGLDLHALANGPIMDPNRIYLPAGRLTEAEYRARMAQALAGHDADHLEGRGE
jgi:hypothetical protein